MTTTGTEVSTAGTPLRLLADHKVREQSTKGLDEWVAERRTRGDSWRRISFELLTLTGVEVTNESLRRWFSDADAA